jgi:UTP--glucose-1-phosphate uridylyltransferase
MRKITKAVFPVAGLGSRFLPATKAQPKEMLPIVDKPLIQYAVEEAVAAGITDMVFITGRNKRAIEDHFDKAYELESQLEAAGKQQLLDLVRNVIPKHINCIFIRQSEALGLGHAVLCARPVVGDDPFAVLLADDFMDVPTGERSVMAQMVDVYAREGLSVLAVQDVPRADTRQYGNTSPASSASTPSSRSRTRTARHRRWPWSGATC